MKNLLVILLTLGLAADLGAQSVSREDRLAVLRFGIESEVLELVRALKQEQNKEYREPLLGAYANARNDELKEALLLLFLDLKDNGLEAKAIDEIAHPEKKGNSLLLNAVSYLTEIKSLLAKDTLVSLMNDKNKVLALASIRALGKLGARDKINDLLKLYQDAETDPNFKPDMIWAFGEMKAGSAVDLLLKEYDDNESQPLLRRSILEALGKIADGKAWDRVEAALADTNTDLRAAAVATIASYPGKGDQNTLLTSALRDTQPAVRLAGAQAAKAAKLPSLKDLLEYRIKKDPDAKVRVAALQALAVYDDGPSLVLGFLGDRKTDPTVWKASLDLALEKKYSGTFDVLKKVIEADVKDKQGNLSAVIAGAVLPQRETYRALFGLILTSEKVPARSTALRAIGIGKFTEYEGVLKSLAAKDPDAGVKTQASNILKDWGSSAPEAKKP